MVCLQCVCVQMYGIQSVYALNVQYYSYHMRIQCVCVYVCICVCGMFINGVYVQNVWNVHNYFNAMHVCMGVYVHTYMYMDAHATGVYVCVRIACAECS